MRAEPNGKHDIQGETSMSETVGARSGARDFDFLMGSWKVRNRRLRARLQGCTDWDEFDATNDAHPLLRGLANEDEFVTGYAGGLVGMSFRFFDPATGLWAIYWADSKHGRLEPPVRGRFEDGVGIFEGDDTLDGRAIRVRFRWSDTDRGQPRWEQAFSADAGASWEVNWTMDFTRTGEAA
jgi:hypothetical protein